MYVWLILAVVIALVSSTFALQNAVPITVAFFKWKLQGSLALVLGLTLASGIVIGVLVMLPGLIKRSWAVASLKRELGRLKKESNLETFEGEPPGGPQNDDV